MSNIKGRNISLIPDDIVTFKADALVSSIPQNKDISTGLAGNVCRAAGLEVSQKLKERTGELKFGEVVDVPPGKLATKSILFVCVSRYKEGHDEKLLMSIYNCLKLASEKNYTSIVFPALGMGGHRYPPSVSAFTILTAIILHFNEVTASSLQNVYICLQDRQKENIQQFVDACCAILLSVSEEGDDLEVAGVENFDLCGHKGQGQAGAKAGGASFIANCKARPAAGASKASVDKKIKDILDIAAGVFSRLSPIIFKNFQLGNRATSPFNFYIHPGFNQSSVYVRAELSLSIPKAVQWLTSYFKNSKI